MDAYTRLIQCADTPADLARRLGMSQQRLFNWRVRGVPADRVLEVCRSLDWQVSPHQLRPDLYPHAEDGLPEERRRAA